MRIALAQMHMDESVEENLKCTLMMMRQAKAAGADLILFPEIQLSPFFPKHEKRDAAIWRMEPAGAEVRAICAECRKLGLWASPNVYLDMEGGSYDASLLIDAQGKILGISKMVNIYQGKDFYECDYYTPSDTGFKVYETPFGKLGIVICFDRHIPESIRTCALGGAELILIPTANLASEPLELFAWEVRIQAFQNLLYIAMCNRVGKEEGKVFAGESLVAGPDGELLFKACGEEGLYCVDIPLARVEQVRRQRNWLSFAPENLGKKQHQADDRLA